MPFFQTIGTHSISFSNHCGAVTLNIRTHANSTLGAQIAAYNCVSRFLVALDGEIFELFSAEINSDLLAVGEENGLKPGGSHDN